MNKQLLFIHIPKTAGTSFRLAAQEYFGKENTFYDYNQASAETSSCIKKYVYEEKDMFRLGQRLKKNRQIFLSGHFSVTKYMPFFDTLNIITFMRNPIERVVSHYKHYCRDLNYNKDFATFIRDEHFKNLQFKQLRGKPLELYGFIGLTEQYEQSIKMINCMYDINLKVLKTNISSEKSNIDIVLSEDIIDLIKSENKNDFSLYEKAQKLFDKRIECFKHNKPYTYLFVQEEKKNSIRGIAIQKDSNEPVLVGLKDGDKKLRLKAKNFRPGMLKQNLPRDGFVGFAYRSKNLSRVKLI